MLLTPVVSGCRGLSLIPLTFRLARSIISGELRAGIVRGYDRAILRLRAGDASPNIIVKGVCDGDYFRRHDLRTDAALNNIGSYLSTNRNDRIGRACGQY